MQAYSKHRNVTRLSQVSLLVSLVCVGMFIPTSAWAWGPSTHLHLGLQVLENLALLPVVLQDLLAFYKHQYLYGCVSADVIVGKRFIEYRHHCHNWRVGTELLNKCDKDSLRAFVLGYLSHLAADTVAHNLFVPQKVVESYAYPTKGHLYWESVFDKAVTNDVILDMIYSLAGTAYEEEDNLLRDSLRPTLFSFPTNKKLFNGFLLLQRFKRWQAIMERRLRNSRVRLRNQELEACNNLSLNAILGFLIDRENSQYMRLDPTGTAALEQSKQCVRVLRSLKRQHGNSRKGREQIDDRLNGFLYDFQSDFQEALKRAPQQAQV